MCIIVHKPEGITLDEIVYRNCFNRNDHGAGLAFIENDQLVIKKGFHKIEEFLKIVKDNEEKELIIHCRLMSKGEVSDENCHPFLVKSEMFPNYSFAVMHNGTLGWRSTKDKSDTAFFVEDALTPLLGRDPYFFEHEIDRKMMGAWIGSNNKLCVMGFDSETKEFTVNIVNEQEGINYNGCWFSNLSFTEEFTRMIFDSDRKKIENWKPKLWVDRTVTTYVQSTTNHYRGANTGSIRDEELFDEMAKSGGEWRHAEGFGWYCIDTKYVGRRGLAEYNKWRLAKETAVKAPGSLKKSTLDQLDYLSKEEVKTARRICLEIVKEAYPDFNFKQCSNIELATWAREELRTLIPALNNMSNEALMHHILYGETPVAKA